MSAEEQHIEALQGARPSKIWHIIPDSFPTVRFSIWVGLLVLLFALSFEFHFLYRIALAMGIIYIAVLLSDLIILWNSGLQIDCKREINPMLSLGDENPVLISLHNHSALKLGVIIIDELPVQVQRRDAIAEITLDVDQQREVIYHISPKERGEYHFGDIQLIISTPLGLWKRKYTVPAQVDLKTYPSIMQMKEFELKAFSRISTSDGIKKIRRSGVSYEFEQISNYVKGDDIRHINWKASARGQDLMVNRFETERSQSVYNVICKNREMRMPFNGLSLLDHAVNTSLAISNIALLKSDRIGLITFSDRIGSTLKASRGAKQLKSVMSALYNERERETEANYDLLSLSLRQLAPNRSLVFLYINFESSYALDRALPHLKSISKRHLLVVIFFKNVEIESFARSKAEDLRGIYRRSIAQKMIDDKTAMLKKLKQAKIQAILTEPDRLSMHTVDKYLELKGRGAI